MCFDAQMFDPKSEVSEVAEVVEGPQSVAAENPRRRRRRRRRRFAKRRPGLSGIC